MELRGELASRLKSLRLSGMLATFENRVRQAEEERWGYGELVSRLLEDEIERRQQQQLASRLKKGQINATKTLENFDWAFNPTINRSQILRLASCEFILAKKNLLVYGPTGTGKSHLAQALANEAARQGFSVLAVGTARMLAHLAGGRADGSVERRLATYLRPDLLILDEFGLKKVLSPGPEDMYDLICARYETGSILLTSNRAPSEWPELFGDPLLASAGLDRLAHHAESLQISGGSYRRGKRGREGADAPPSSGKEEAPPSSGGPLV